MSADERRTALLEWLHERAYGAALTAREAVDASGIYTGHGRYDRCFDDLKVLEAEGYVDRSSGRPAQWEVVTA